MIPYRVSNVRRLGPSRLTAGLDEHRRLDLNAHHKYHDRLPGQTVDALISMAEEVDLRGRGGAAFPFARKLRAVSARDGETVVLVNAAEGEPASLKDKTLLTRAPHLVLEGALLAASALGSREVVVAVGAGELAEASVTAAVAERGLTGLVRVVAIEERFISGEGGALVRAVNGEMGLPPGRKVRSSDSGVYGLPTLLSNTETFAQLAVLAELGPEEYAAVGTVQEPGTILLTVGGSVGAPSVVEAPPGVPLADVLALCEAKIGDGLLLGGYHGTWMSAEAAYGTVLSRRGAKEAGGELGAGIVVVLGEDTCPLGETARVAGYLAAQSAGQCGPCRLGLPDLARAFRQLQDGDPDGPEAVRRAAAAVKGRGACFHPDGSARFVLSALDAFADDVEEHRFHGGCGRETKGVLPLPVEEARDVRLMVDWTRCQGHGLCAHLVPELVKLDHHGFPVFMDTGVPSWLLGDAQKAVEMCPALALRIGAK
ncbi:NADH-ubiquinone oxidoreductase-F iron-sulfur binding region domain-containing protein [Microbispora triticiradicis]|uniref:NADH-ubiquinone oxidoreductase-F iron-sulfur binding region domain-containing protein n=1 Tax=Microbispora triticiradicis TaxID=2200763 RepID=UPI0026BB18DC|nr:NADH-ubiquinone oxidoreductase-F iron-sulfur binding region domain-containing protein [Microbispora triticiradicis]